MLKKMLFGLVALGMGGCAVYVPGPAVVGPGFVVGPGPLYLGGVYPYRRYGYYGYYGWHRGYYR